VPTWYLLSIFGFPKKKWENTKYIYIYIKKKYSEEIQKIIGAKKDAGMPTKIGWGDSKMQKVEIWQWEPCWQGKFNLRKKSPKSDVYGLN